MNEPFDTSHVDDASDVMVAVVSIMTLPPAIEIELLVSAVIADAPCSASDPPDTVIDDWLATLIDDWPLIDIEPDVIAMQLA